MSSISSLQFNYLMDLRKRFLASTTVDLSGRWTEELISLDERETFQLDFERSNFEFRKMKLNKRYRTCIVLVRLCTKKRHTNPDGTIFPDAHVHIYCEEYSDAEAHPISILGLEPGFTNEEAFEAFTRYCNIVVPRLQVTIEGAS